MREAQTQANEERVQGDRDNDDDMATFWSHARGWPALMNGRPRVAQIGREADRRREEHVVMPLRRWRGSGGCGAESGALAQVAEDLEDRNVDQSAAGEGNVEAVVPRSRLEAGVQQCVLVQGVQCAGRTGTLRDLPNFDGRISRAP